MLERYYVWPKTIDRIQASWIGKQIEQYVAWLAERGYSPRSVQHRVPVLVHFGEFARARGARRLEALPRHAEAFARAWVQERNLGSETEAARKKAIHDAWNPIDQMLRLAVPNFRGRNPSRELPDPFKRSAAGFFEFLREERGLRPASIRKYCHHLREFEAYLVRIRVARLRSLSPTVLSAFIAERSKGRGRSSLRDVCGVLRVFLRYLRREGHVSKDLSLAVEGPRTYRLSSIPRSITWDEVRRMLEAVERRSPTGRRDYAILLLLVTYGLRGREVAALTLDDIDWKQERLRIPERKAGHSTAYPLSSIVGNALLDYLQRGRPKTADRHVFFRGVVPLTPLTASAVSGRAAYYMHKAGIAVSRAGSHTLRHTCVQRLVDADFSLKTIGDYVGHRVPESTEIYAKVDVDALRQVALSGGEEIL